MRTIRNLIGGVGLCAPLLLPAVVSAHAFGGQYTLPVPFSLYAVGAAYTLVASFVILLFFSKPRAKLTYVPKIWGRLPRKAILALRIFGVAVLVFTVLVGLLGAQDITRNIAPILFWIVLLLGMTYVSVFVGGLWRLMNPFESLVRIILGAQYRGLRKYPDWLGYVPAFVFYLSLIKLEVLSHGIGAVPFVLAMILLAYLVVSLLGSAVFGTDSWFTRADLFNVFFGLVGRFAPVHISPAGEVDVRLPTERLADGAPKHLSALFFVLFMLSSTAFDGLRETQVWVDIFYQYPIIFENSALFSHFALLLSPFLFFAVYACAVYLMKILTHSEHSLRFLLLRFAYSLIPIAIAYSFAHYFTILLSGIQSALPLISDPWGMGWNLFGTAGYQAGVGLIGARLIWDIQVIVIVVGHIIATYVAHRIALEEFREIRNVAIGQLPMLLLMVLYTVFGLWILSLGFALPS